MTTPLTLTDLLEGTLARHPERAATIETVEGTPVVTTYAELAAEVGRARSRLAAHGVRRGDRVAYWAENRREFLVWHLACAAEGVVVVGTNTRYRAVEVAHVLATARPVLVIVPERLLALDLSVTLHQALERVVDEPGWEPPQVALLPATSPHGVAPTRDPDAVRRFDAGAGAWWADEAVSTPDVAPVGTADDLAMTFTTSGSTGLPKLAAHDQDGIAAHALAVGEAIGLAPGDVVCCALPLTGVFAYVPALAALASGAANLMVPVFDGATTIAQMAEHRVTHVFGGDDLYLGLHEGWLRDEPQLPHWRVAGVASFVGRVEQLVPWLDACSGARMLGVYGSSEVFSLLSIRDTGTGRDRAHLGGGRLVGPEYAVRVVDPVSGSPVPEGEVGALQFRGRHVLQSYLRATAAVPPDLDDGWFDSGDLGSVEPGEDARVFTYEGRAGDALRLRGFLVQPSEIEHFLVAQDGVDLVKVVGAQSEDRQVALAFVTTTGGADPGTLTRDLMARCRAELAPFKVPNRIVVIDEMPVTSGTNGSKIKAGELRDRAAALLS